MASSFLLTVVSIVAVVSSAAAFFYARKLRAAVTRVRLAEEGLADCREGIREAEGEKRRTVAILESMTEGVAVIDSDQKVLLMNTALALSIGIPKTQAESRYFWEIFRDADVNEMMEKAVSSRQPVQAEHSILLSDAIFQIQISPVFSGKDFLGIVAVFYDVTKLKALEKARTEFVANVSHELKTPLTSIMGFVETLKEGAIEDAENRLRFLAIIEEHSKKLHRLIEDLLTLSRIESGVRELDIESVDFGKLLDSTLGLFEKRLEENGIRVERQIETAPFLFRADTKAMEDVLTNLLDNAIKYNEREGRILVKASRGPDGVRLEVRDTGIGIPESDRARVFERFYRVEKSRSRESGGTGLGLAIVKHLVERHGGRIEAHAVPPKGTSFLISLPGA